jgi:hypothetical protein
MNWGLGEAWKERQLGGSWRESLESFESLPGDREGRSGEERRRRAIVPFALELCGVSGD